MEIPNDYIKTGYFETDEGVHINYTFNIEYYLTMLEDGDVHDWLKVEYEDTEDAIKKLFAIGELDEDDVDIDYNLKRYLNEDAIYQLEEVLIEIRKSEIDIAREALAEELRAEAERFGEVIQAEEDN